MPLLLGVLIFAVLLALWRVQQSNVNSLAQQSDALQQQIDALPATVAPEDKLALQKDRLTLEKDRVNAQNAIYGTLIQAIGGAFFFVTTYLTWRNVKATEEKQVTERFSKAIELLGSKNLEVRLGGIYALERIAKDSEKDYWTIMEVLTGFVRERTKSRWEEAEKKQLSPLPTDIQAVLSVLKRRTPSYKQEEKYRLDLSGSVFSWMIVGKVSFKKMVLNVANFHQTYLNQADLSEADLSGADFTKANLKGAILKDALLQAADFSGAYLSGADLTKANLKRATLKGAIFSSEANLTDADLTDADFSEAILNKTIFSKAKLRGAYFGGADLSGAINLTQEQISEAITDENTKLPDYLQSPKPSQPESPNPHSHDL